MATKILKKPDTFYTEYTRSPSKDKKIPHYCPGCGHGNIHKMIAEALMDFEIGDNTILISPVGCSVFAYYYFDTGNIQSSHGRAPAVATGIKRARPNSIVISYQGDGDLAAIGTAEILHAANRGENITVFFVNNAIYGMTGGQMAPTTLTGQRTTTTPYGRAPENEGYPLKVCEILSQLQSPVYIERVALIDNKSRARARLAIRKAIKNQMGNLGFSLVEILSPCPTGWKLDPLDAIKWMVEKMLVEFPLAVFKDRTQEVEPYAIEKKEYPSTEIKSLLDIEGGMEAMPRVANISETNQNPEIKIAGFGGQGILLMGAALAQAGMLEDYHVSWLPSYGPEMRGGTANCVVNIKTEEVGSPLVQYPTVLIAMNRPSLEKFEADVVPGGVLIYDSSLIDIEPKREDIHIVAIPATQMADDLGVTRIANMIILGTYIGFSGILARETLYKSMETAIKRKQFIELNRKAIDKGFEYGQLYRKKNVKNNKN